MNLPNYYELLGVPETATDAEIRKAHRAKLLACHPDRHPGPEATELAKRLGEAKHVLTNPKARAAYDAARRPGADAGGTSVDVQEAIDLIEQITGVKIETMAETAIDFVRDRALDFLRGLRKR